MRGLQRRLAILQAVREQGHVESAVLAERFGVSMMTIRRDLTKLQDEGLVTCEYGGAVLNEGMLYEHDMYMKQLEHQDEKARIARCCADMVHEHEAIFLDAGSTVVELARLLARRSDLSITTHSLLVAQALATSKAEITMCPGRFRPTSMAYMGQMTDRFVGEFRFDRMFLSVEGFDAEWGVSVPDMADGATKQAVVQSSDWVCCMADSSKANMRYHYRIAGWDVIDRLVVDEAEDASLLDPYRELTEVVTV